MKRIALAALAILIGTAGIRAYSPPGYSTQGLVGVWASTHMPQADLGAAIYAESAYVRVVSHQPSSTFAVDDVPMTHPLSTGFDTRAQADSAYLWWIRQRPMIPVYPGLNNWSLYTAQVVDSARHSYVTHADSLDPLADDRVLVPMIDLYGNYYVDDLHAGLRMIALNSCYNAPGDTCLTNGRGFNPETGLLRGNPQQQDMAYIPTAMYPRWSDSTSVSVRNLKAWIQICRLPHCQVMLPNMFWNVQGDTSASGYWVTPNSAYLYTVLTTTTTALGRHVEIVWGGQQHCCWVAERDSVLFVNLPPCANVHAPATGVQTYIAQVFPDTMKSDTASIAAEKAKGWLAGNELLFSSRFPTRPGYGLVPLSFTTYGVDIYDANGRIYTVRRNCR